MLAMEFDDPCPMQDAGNNDTDRQYLDYRSSRVSILVSNSRVKECRADNQLQSPHQTDDEQGTPEGWQIP